MTTPAKVYDYNMRTRQGRPLKLRSCLPDTILTAT